MQQLNNGADGYQIWSERYDRQMEDVFDIQDEIAKAIVGALKVTVPAPLSWLQVVVRLLPAGNPSSLTVPSRVTVSVGRVIVAGVAVAETVGAWLVGGARTVMSTESVAVAPW